MHSKFVITFQHVFLVLIGRIPLWINPTKKSRAVRLGLCTDHFLSPRSPRCRPGKRLSTCTNKNPSILWSSIFMKDSSSLLPRQATTNNTKLLPFSMLRSIYFTVAQCVYWHIHAHTYVYCFNRLTGSDKT